MESLKNLKEVHKDFIEVGYFYESCKKLFNLELISKNRGFQRKITERNVHRPGLALAGFFDLFTYNRVQVFGNTELSYLKKLNSKKKKRILDKFCSYKIPCIVVTNNAEIDPAILEAAHNHRVSIFRSSYSTTKTLYHLSDFLDDQFSVRTTIHGSFVDVYGVGLLVVGRSGIGKSEIAMDLVERGHRLVADDIVIVSKKGEGILIGSSTNISKDFMEIRGIGLINIPKMFGIRAIRYQKRIEVVVILEEFNKDKEYTRTGLETNTVKILNVDIPVVNLPIFPGKNITVIAEVIALNYLLNHYGYNAAEDLNNLISEHNKLIKKNYKLKDNRAISYFENDPE